MAAVRRHWRLNERHYGALQGKNKEETAAESREDQVLAWRRSYATPPPPVDPGAITTQPATPATGTSRSTPCPPPSAWPTS